MTNIGLFGAFFVIYMFFLIISILVAIAIAIFQTLCYYFIFEKAGIPGWKAIIPFYNLYYFYKVCGFNGWFFLMEFVPVAGIVFRIFTSINLAEAFGKGTGYVFGFFFVPDVFRGIVAFDRSYYRKPTRISF